MSPTPSNAIRVFDVTENKTLGYATVNGNNFSLAFTLDSPGKHNIQVITVDSAGKHGERLLRRVHRRDAALGDLDLTGPAEPDDHAR